MTGQKMTNQHLEKSDKYKCLKKTEPGGPNGLRYTRSESRLQCMTSPREQKSTPYNLSLIHI